MPIHKFMGFAPDGRKICSCELTGSKWNNCNEAKPGKHPWCGWKQKPMGTPEEGYATFKEFWDKHPTGVNIGIRTGKVSGFWALDIDVGPGKHGVEDLQNWAQREGISLEEMDTTLLAKTGGGGFHYVFKYPEGVDKITTVAPHPDIGPSVDVKGDGGYILVAPSLHTSNRQYLWFAPPEPASLHNAPPKLVTTVESRRQSVVDIDMSYTPSLPELKEFADTLSLKKKPSQKTAGKNMVAALSGEAIMDDGGAHDAYRNIMFYIATRWPKCDASEILEHFKESITVRCANKADASTDMANIRDSMVTALEKVQEKASSWVGQLMLNDNGKPLGTVGNTQLFFENHPAWKDGIGFNVRTRNYAYTRVPPIGGKARDVDEDHDGVKLSTWFQIKTDMVLDSKKALDALHSVANDHHFDPLYQDLITLRGTWDGVSRLDTILQRVGGAEDTAWVRTVFPLWMKSLVARIMMPGCKVDTMLILEGLQGYKKSTFFEALMANPQWFSDSLTRVKHDVATHRLLHSGPAIFEVGELTGLRKQDVEDIKAFLSSKVDTFDDKYRKPRAVPRRCILVGSTNAATYLRDESGGRRFWPVKIHRKINVSLVEAERGQWMAEALHRFEAGEKHWIHGDAEEVLAAFEQDQRYEEDIWDEPVTRWLDAGLLEQATGAPSGTQQMAENANKTRAGEYVTLAQVAEYALGMEIKNAKPGESERIKKILRREGWLPCRVSINKKQVRAWRRPVIKK